MKISMHTMAVESFVPMLESLSEFLDKGAEHSKKNNLRLIDARLAPDMYTLAQQVQLACHHARDGMARLTGQSPVAIEDAQTTFDGMKAQIARTLASVRGVTAAEFEGAEERDCGIDIENRMVIEMNGSRFLRAWALPHFYFHIVTAYDILRHHGVAIGKKDYLSQVGNFIRARKT
jgi:hypothetical protein